MFEEWKISTTSIDEVGRRYWNSPDIAFIMEGWWYTIILLISSKQLYNRIKTDLLGRNYTPLAKA